LVERELPKLEVAGSKPVVRFGAAWRRVPMSTYLPALAEAVLVRFWVLVCRALPASRRPLTVLAVLLAATVFAQDLALGLRVLAAVLTAILAVGCLSQLRRA
jgi:hypothetical protein